MTTQSLVKKEPLEEDVMSTAIYPTGMCVRRVFHCVLDVYHCQLAMCLYSVCAHIHCTMFCGLRTHHQIECS